MHNSKVCPLFSLQHGGLGDSPRRRGSGSHDKAKHKHIIRFFLCLCFATRDCSEGKAFPSLIFVKRFQKGTDFVLKFITIEFFVKRCLHFRKLLLRFLYFRVRLQESLNIQPNHKLHVR